MPERALVFFSVKSYLSLIVFQVGAVSLYLAFKNHLKLCMTVYMRVCVYFLAFNLGNLCFLSTNYLLDSDSSAFLKQPQQTPPVRERPSMWLSLCGRPLVSAGPGMISQEG